MTNNNFTEDLWRGAALLAWMAIFMMGLFPEVVFYTLREQGYVVSQRAITNNYWTITLASAGFLGWFVFRRCIECQDEVNIALGKGVQVIILALTAFLPLHIQELPLHFAIPIPGLRRLLLTIVAIKGLTWLYLVTLLLRYYFGSGHAVFKNMPLVFPSAYRGPRSPRAIDDKEGPAAGE